ncbi:MAG: tetratricopeptide repeat protein [Candidatus Riflebacteria bacterium]|nr:tetratricopeptide repeat protein [Candidatus Riflebacteria bacterium]
MKKGLTVLLFAALSSTLTAADINWDELEKKAQQYTGELEKKGAGDSSRGTVTNLVIPGQPQGRTIDNSARELTEADKRHITVHMKLANRHFARKNYPKAIEEIELVFEREPDNAGARFMRAVIAGRLRDHKTAWYNVLIAKDKDGANPKIDSFINKLKTVAPEPENPEWVAGVFRSVPVTASEKVCDVIERLLLDQVSHNITSLQIDDFIEESGTVKVPVQIECSSPPEKDAILGLLRKATGNDASIKSSEGKKLSLNFSIKGLPLINPAVKPVSELQEFIKGLTEEIDVAISDSVEREAENKQLDIIYEISTRDFKTLNDFLRKIAPYSPKFRVQNLKLAYITGTQSIIWKCKVQIFFQIT